MATMIRIFPADPESELGDRRRKPCSLSLAQINVDTYLFRRRVRRPALIVLTSCSRLQPMETIGGFHTIRIKRNGVVELIMIPIAANDDGVPEREGSDSERPVEDNRPSADTVLPDAHANDQTPDVSTVNGDGSYASQPGGAQLPLLPVHKVEPPNKDASPALLGIVVEADTVSQVKSEGHSERATVSTRDFICQVAASDMEAATGSVAGQTLSDGVSSETTTVEPSQMDTITAADIVSANRPGEGSDMRVSDETTAFFYPPQSSQTNRVRLVNAPTAAGERPAKAGKRSTSFPSRQRRQSTKKIKADTEADFARLGLEPMCVTAMIPPENLRGQPKRKSSAMAKPVCISQSRENIPTQDAVRGIGSAVIQGGDCSRSLLVRRESPSGTKTSGDARGCLVTRTPPQVIRLKAFSSKTTPAVSTVASSVTARSQDTVVVTRPASSAQPVNALAACTPGLSATPAASHPDASTGGATLLSIAVPGEPDLLIRNIPEEMRIAARQASMSVTASHARPKPVRRRQATKASRPRLTGPAKPRQPVPAMPMGTNNSRLPAPATVPRPNKLFVPGRLPLARYPPSNAPAALPRAYLVYPNGMVAPLYEVSTTTVTRKSSLPIQPTSTAPSATDKSPVQNTAEPSSTSADAMPLLLPAHFKNPLAPMQTPLSPDLPEINSAITSTTIPEKRQQSQPSAALPLRGAANADPVTGIVVSNHERVQGLNLCSFRQESDTVKGNASAHHRFTGLQTPFPGTTEEATSASIASLTSAVRLHSSPIVDATGASTGNSHQPQVSSFKPRRTPSSAPTHHPAVDSSASNALRLPTSPLMHSDVCYPVYGFPRSRLIRPRFPYARPLDTLPSDENFGGASRKTREEYLPLAPDTPYRRPLPRIYGRPDYPLSYGFGYGRQRCWRHADSSDLGSEPDENLYPWDSDLDNVFIPGGPGGCWGFRPMPGATPLFPRSRYGPTPARYGRRTDMNSGADFDLLRPYSDFSMPEKVDPAEQVFGIDYESIKRRRDTGDEKRGPAKKKNRRQRRSSMIGRGRAVSRKRGRPTRRHPVVRHRQEHLNIRPCSVVITKLSTRDMLMSKCNDDIF